MDTGLKVAIARKYGSRNDLACFEGLTNFIRQVTTITNACHTTISSSRKANLIKELVKARLCEILGDYS